MVMFSVGDNTTHRIGDRRCPACAETYPESCTCGGLVHASAGEPGDVERDAELTTACDHCGRSDDELAEAV